MWTQSYTPRRRATVATRDRAIATLKATEDCGDLESQAAGHSAQVGRPQDPQRPGVPALPNLPSWLPGTSGVRQIMSQCEKQATPCQRGHEGAPWKPFAFWLSSSFLHNFLEATREFF